MKTKLITLAVTALVALASTAWAGPHGGGGSGHFGGGGFGGGHVGGGFGGGHFDGFGGGHFGGARLSGFNGGGLRAPPQGFASAHFAGQSFGTPGSLASFYHGRAGTPATRPRGFTAAANRSNA